MIRVTVDSSDGCQVTPVRLTSGKRGQDAIRRSLPITRGARPQVSCLKAGDLTVGPRVWSGDHAPAFAPRADYRAPARDLGSAWLPGGASPRPFRACHSGACHPPVCSASAVGVTMGRKRYDPGRSRGATDFGPRWRRSVEACERILASGSSSGNQACRVDRWKSLCHPAWSEETVRAGQIGHRRGAGHCRVFPAMDLSVVVGSQRREVQNDLF